MKKGFTLIELLAVILILAIIAVIAVPIVLNVINDSKETARIRSAEQYLEAVKLSIFEVSSNSKKDFYSRQCLINEKGNLLCNNYKNEIIIEIDGEKPNSGEILFKKRDIIYASLIYDDVAVISDKDGNLSYDSTTYKKVLEVNGVKYSRDEFVVAFENSSKDTPVKLLSDFTLKNIYTLTYDKEMFLNLNGKTITIESGGIVLKGNNSSLTIENGNINALGNSSAISVGENEEEVSNVTKRHLIIKSDVNINAESYGISGFGKSTIDFYGKITLSKKGYGLSGNGNANNKNTTFNIYAGSSIIAEKGVALYLPQYGATTISGGTLKGDTAIGIKSGTLNIVNGEFHAIGTKKEPILNNDGINPTGDVILIEEQTGYYGNVNINITGGKFESKNGYIIQENNVSGRTVIVSGIYSNKVAVPDTTNKYYYTN